MSATAHFNQTHGYSRVGKRKPEYVAWINMWQRCTNPKFTYYRNYGGRGIEICERWEAFENFLEDMGEKPSLSHSIDRIDVNGNYEPSNCRWATKSQQAFNRRKR